MSRGKWSRDPCSNLHYNDLDEIPGMDESDVMGSLMRLPVMSGKNIFSPVSLACVIGASERHFRRNIATNPTNPYNLSSYQIIREDRKSKTTVYGGNEDEMRKLRAQIRIMK